MKNVHGMWLPDDEQHLVSFLQNGPSFEGGPTYQFHKLEACIPFIKKHDYAVDVGAHCGLWARPLSHMFSIVDAFEPVDKHRECLVANLKKYDRTNVSVLPFALGDHAGDVSLHSGPASSGDTYISENGEHSAKMITLDAYLTQPVDFLKIDCEGYELYVLRGGEAAIRSGKPCIIVEQKPNKGSQFSLADTAAVDLLKSWGATLRKEISGDYIFSWE